MAKRYNRVPHGHYYASSVAEWRTGTDYNKLVKEMKTGGFSFFVVWVPLPYEAEYEIEHFAPAVKGAVLMEQFLYRDDAVVKTEDGYEVPGTSLKADTREELTDKVDEVVGVWKDKDRMTRKMNNPVRYSTSQDTMSIDRLFNKLEHQLRTRWNETDDMAYMPLIGLVDSLKDMYRVISKEK